MTGRGEKAAERRSQAARIRRWKRYLADERTEESLYRELAARRRNPDDREILLGLADAERRHQAHWTALLGEEAAARPGRGSLRSRLLARLARLFGRRSGKLFVLALAQQSEGRSPYQSDADASAAMAADERIHAEVVRALAARGRVSLAGTFRAAVFGANDGLVSNLALVLGMSATGVAREVVLFTGIAGLLAGAFSMGAGEFVSVRSQRELLEASRPDPAALGAVLDLDVDANELALVYRARGMGVEEAAERAAESLATRQRLVAAVDTDDYEAIGSAWHAAGSSFAFFAIGAAIPILPWLLGMSGSVAVLVAAVLVGVALLITGGIVGVLSGATPYKRAFRQLAIGLGAAAITYLVGWAFGAVLA